MFSLEGKIFPILFSNSQGDKEFLALEKTSAGSSIVSAIFSIHTQVIVTNCLSYDINYGVYCILKNKMKTRREVVYVGS